MKFMIEFAFAMFMAIVSAGLGGIVVYKIVSWLVSVGFLP